MPVTGSVARDGRTTMRIVFANGIERIMSMPFAGNGQIPSTTMAAMHFYAKTAEPWIASDKAYLQQLEDARGKPPQEAALAVWSAVIAALMRAEMLDRSSVPTEDYEAPEEGGGGG